MNTVRVVQNRLEYKSTTPGLFVVTLASLLFTSVAYLLAHQYINFENARIFFICAVFVLTFGLFLNSARKTVKTLVITYDGENLYFWHKGEGYSIPLSKVKRLAYTFNTINIYQKDGDKRILSVNIVATPEDLVTVKKYINNINKHVLFIAVNLS